eukprot:1149527-Pelagomonas_calceolata.AAC.3
MKSMSGSNSAHPYSCVQGPPVHGSGTAAHSSGKGDCSEHDTGYQCPVIRNVVIERHNMASRMVLKVDSKGSYASNLMHIDVCSADRLAQHDLHITEHVSNYFAPPYLSDPSIPDQGRRNSSRPDAILVTPCPAYPNRPLTPPSHPGTLQHET